MPVLALLCAVGLWTAHRANVPSPPEPLPDTFRDAFPPAPVRPSPSSPQAPAPLSSSPPPPTAPRRPPSPTPPTAPEPQVELTSGKGFPIYTGMMKMGGTPMALFEGRSAAVELGEEIGGAVLIAIEPKRVTVRRDGVQYILPLDTNPGRYKGAPPQPTPIRVPPLAARRAPPADPQAPYPAFNPGAARGTVDQRPGTVVSRQTFTGPPVFVPVTPVPVKYAPVAGSGCSR